MRDDKDRANLVLASEPINITAKRVMFKGENPSEPSNYYIGIHTDICPPLRARPKNNRSPEFVDYTCVKFGSFIVIGLFDNKRGLYTTGKSVWVVKCHCGKYETRLTKSIKNPKNQKDKCRLCRHDDYLKRKDKYRQLGYNEEETLS